jgi:hypothetical protein
MIEASIGLDISGERWAEGLAFGCYPIQNRTLETFSVVRPGARRALLHLA